MFKFLGIIVLYAMIGTGVFLSVASRTEQRCPDEDKTRAIIYGLAWPLLLGYKLLEADMAGIPHCNVVFPDQQKEGEK